MTELIDRIVENRWMGKEGLTIPSDVLQAIYSPLDWFESLEPVKFLKDGGNPVLGNLLLGIPEEKIAQSTKQSSLLLLESAYSTNRAFNSVKYPDLLDTANLALNKINPGKREKSVYDAASLGTRYFLNPRLLEEDMEIPEAIGESISSRLDRMTNTNRSFLEQLLTDLQASINQLAGKAKIAAKRTLKRIERILNGSLKDLELLQLNTSRSLEIARVAPTLTATGIIPATINIFTTINGWLLSTFLAKSLVDLPIQLMGALSSTSTAIALKSLEVGGADVARYLAGDILRKGVMQLPNVWTVAGTFTGSWTLLLAAAGVMVLASVITKALIERSRDLEVGNKFYILATENPTFQPDLIYARASGNKNELLKSFNQVKDNLIDETFKNYRQIYGFSFNNNGERKLCADMSNPIMIPMSDSQSEALWNQFKVLEYIEE